MRPDAFRKPRPVYGHMGPATFDQVASTKLSVRINLKKPEGAALAKRLVRPLPDIAAESFAPGLIGRLGSGFDDLVAVKPDIIMLSVSSSGQTGPDRHFAGYAPLFGAWGGLGEMTGYADGPPVEMRHVMDHTVGMNAAVAVLAALHRRRATGEGGLVDVSAREVSSSLLGEALLLAAAGEEPHRAGNDHPCMAPHGVYPAAGEDQLDIDRSGRRRAMAGLRGGHRPPRAGRRPALCRRGEPPCQSRRTVDIVSAWTRTCDANAAAELLQAAGIAAHASPGPRPRSPRTRILRMRGSIVEVAEPDGKLRAAVGVPMRLSKGTRSASTGARRGSASMRTMSTANCWE